MTPPLADLWPGVAQPVIGMLHLPPLPGSPRYGGDPAAIRTRVLEDARTWVEVGVHGLLLENFGDAPFHKAGAGPHVVAWMTSIAVEVRHHFNLPLGINVLRNDAESALAIAASVFSSEGGFIRFNVLCGAKLTDQGIIEGPAAMLLRRRVELGAGHIRILADINVKHASPLGSPRPLAEEVGDTLHRGLADGLIVTGAATGQATPISQLSEVRAAAGEAPVFVGSGISADALGHYSDADGFIVGSWAKREGRVENPVDPERVRALMAAWHGLHGR